MYKQCRRYAHLRGVIWVILLWAVSVSAQESLFPPALLFHDEGGPVFITGQLTYTNLFFTDGVAEPVIILEDQAGFIDRNRYYIFPPESQTLGQITSPFYTSPFTYSLALPIEPQGTLRDVDNNGQDDVGVMVFAIAYWKNTWGDPFLETRDLAGGGWSTAYASTQVSTDPQTFQEIIGGKLLIYAPDARQGFPADFGDDGLLFTGDEPVVGLPQGYTVIDLDIRPFTFDRARHQQIDLIEPETIALVDFSALPVSEAFDAMLAKFRAEYAFTDYKGIDWDVLGETYRPRFVAAERNGDDRAYFGLLREFLWEIPDGHVRLRPAALFAEQIQRDIALGIGLAVRETDGGQVIVTYLTTNGPAERAGMQLGTQIIAINGVPIQDAITATEPWSQPFSTEHNLRLEQLRYVVRFSAETTSVTVTYQNMDDDTPTTVILRPIGETESFVSLDAGQEMFALPVEYSLHESGYGYVTINTFLDSTLLTIQLWERMIRQMKEANVQGLIVDMRRNNGGDGFLADQMSAYFFAEEHITGYQGQYNAAKGGFFFDPVPRRLYPPPESLQYHGAVAVLIGPQCASACERFVYNLTLRDRAIIVGQYPTAGLGGSVEDFLMPLGVTVRFTVGRSVNVDYNIHIEGQGIAPTTRVPVDADTLLNNGDSILEYAIITLNAQ